MTLYTIGRTKPSKCSRLSSSSYYYSTYSSNDWQCGDSYCIEQYYVCDGVLDCLNGRDEFNCGEWYNNIVINQPPCSWNYMTNFDFIEICRGESFHCDNKRCIERSLHCNGIDECGDGSDEPPFCPGTISLPDVNDILKNTSLGNIYWLQ